ncbi:M42 family metallopeptidase [Clostridium massiliodielmoense]|uniref:M42 family metallopeptidase n=1 Tax=Clostridium massiliodielmoense TaxID=1776385 RepID=UPI0004D59BFB|nr:M42 family peptidase [Clostridium massiliodielmoense]KEH93215.1 aminopeptidase [Clostridium botulinum C/D str. BKT12695]
MLLEKLCNSVALPSYEDEARNLIKNDIKDFVDEIKVDRMGNVVAHKKGNGKTIILDAYMDEVGFIITAFNDDGTLKFTPLGNVDERSIPCKDVIIGDKRINGVIGFKAIHLQSKKEREENIDIEKLSIDIGAKSKEEAKKYVSVGDYVSFTSEFGKLGNRFIKGKALDSRIPCYILIELLKENYDADIYAIFSVQKQVGSRGAIVSSYNKKSDITIIVENGLSKNNDNVIDKGPSLSRMDGNVVCDNDIINDIKSIGEKESIPYEIKNNKNRGNSGDSYVENGSKIVTISVPCKYMNSAISVSSTNDIKSTIKLIRGYLKSL